MCGCQFATQNSGPAWSPEDSTKPAPSNPDGAKDIYRPDILEHIEATIKQLDEKLKALCLDIHSKIF